MTIFHNICLVCLLFIATFAKANTNVWLTNNTLAPIYVKSALITSDDDFFNQKDLMWHFDEGMVHPLETKQIAWFSRNQHLKANTLYRYLICVSETYLFNQCALDTSSQLRYQFDVVGNRIYGSTLRTHLKRYETDNIEVLTKDGLEHWDNSPHHWSHLYGRSWLYEGEVFSSYHFLVDNINQPGKANHSANELSILSYNTQLMPFYAETVNRLNHPDYRANTIPSYIAEYDIVILQELFDKTHRETLTKKMAANYPYNTAVVGNNKPNFLSGGVMIFSRYPIEVEDSIIFKECANEDCLANKGIAYARINKHGKLYHVFGTHLQAWDNEKARRARQNQILQFAVFIQQKHIPVDEPIIIAGDFNIDVHSEEYRMMQDTLHIMLPLNVSYPFTVDSSVNAMVVGNEKSHLDYIFLESNHKHPNKASTEVVILRDLSHPILWPAFSAIKNALNFSTLDLSDHFAVSAKIVFSNYFIANAATLTDVTI